jgi:hypothetical protein
LLSEDSKSKFHQCELLSVRKMKVNFDILDNIALSYEVLYIDLHNNFDFEKLEYNVGHRELTLTWKKTDGEWVGKNELSKIILTHTGVDYLAISGQGENFVLQDNKTLSEISFFPPHREKSMIALVLSKNRIQTTTSCTSMKMDRQ